MTPKIRLLFIVGFLGTVLAATVVLFYFYTDALRVRVLSPIIAAYYNKPV